MRFEDLPPNLRYDVDRAACRFLVKNRYVSLDEACQAQEVTLPELWSRILSEAGLPESDPPAFAPFS